MGTRTADCSMTGSAMSLEILKEQSSLFSSGCCLQTPKQRWSERLPIPGSDNETHYGGADG